MKNKINWISNGAFFHRWVNRLAGRNRPRQKMDLTQALEASGILPELKKSLETFNQGTCAFCGNKIDKFRGRDLETEAYLRRIGASPIVLQIGSEAPINEEIEVYICRFCGKHTGIGFSQGGKEDIKIQHIPSSIKKAAFLTDPMTHLEAETLSLQSTSACVVSKNVLEIAQNLCIGKRQEIDFYAIACLAMIIDGLALFDKLIVFDYYPGLSLFGRIKG